MLNVNNNYQINSYRVSFGAKKITRPLELKLNNEQIEEFLMALGYSKRAAVETAPAITAKRLLKMVKDEVEIRNRDNEIYWQNFQKNLDADLKHNGIAKRKVK